ncbi:hypothetical protein HMPREF1549_01314 [Actinomyces johnsonii F0510]|uniref:Uncharacterized protein n=1 Tax=Actinomyces johnsonii F0510 TaxID=1227262 RepID=U1PWD7_9ACTO|nr:hypothetical protein HMPREF1549_01314 [Actinomyces johnsonii F0510]
MPSTPGQKCRAGGARSRDVCDGERDRSGAEPCRRPVATADGALRPVPVRVVYST